MTVLKRCRICKHPVHDFALDATGRCGGCVIDIKRRWGHRAECKAGVDPENAWAEIRRQRDALLAESDKTQLADMPEATQLLWKPYRQALRDITKQPDPAAIEWPQQPE